MKSIDINLLGTEQSRSEVGCGGKPAFGAGTQRYQTRAELQGWWQPWPLSSCLEEGLVLELGPQHTYTCQHARGVLGLGPSS